MRTYRCLIVDDERPALQLLTAYIQKLPSLELISSCESAMDALTLLQSQSIDILFLDIQMPEFTGLDLLNMLPSRPQAILTTAYREYAVEGFSLEVTDYLVKPFSFERFVKATNKAINNLKKEIFIHEQAALISTNPDAESSEKSHEAAKSGHLESTTANHFFVRTNHKLEKVSIDEIRYIESMREYSSIHTSGRRFMVNTSLQKINRELPSDYFIRVHRSYIVCFNEIKSIKGNTIVLADKEIPIGASYRKAFFAKVKLL